MEYIQMKGKKQIVIAETVEEKKLKQNIEDLKILMPFILDCFKKFPFLKKYIANGK